MPFKDCSKDLKGLVGDDVELGSVGVGFFVMNNLFGVPRSVETARRNISSCCLPVNYVKFATFFGNFFTKDLLSPVLHPVIFIDVTRGHVIQCGFGRFDLVATQLSRVINWGITDICSEWCIISGRKLLSLIAGVLNQIGSLRGGPKNDISSLWNNRTSTLNILHIVSRIVGMV